MTSALILAAGFGTRLRPLTLERPKPAVPVGDRPLLAHIALACRRAGVSHLFANAHHEHAKLANIIQELSLEIEVVVEHEIRGTAGGVAGARTRFEPGAALVWNGDILTQPPVRELLAEAREQDAQVIAVEPRAVGTGTVGLGADGSVVRLRGRVFGDETQGGDYVGVMALGPAVLASLPERGCLFGDVALPRMAAGHKLWSVPSTAGFRDVGDVPAYAAANFAWLERELGASAGPAGSWLGPGASVASGIVLERCVLGAGARVRGGGLLREVIAWPSAPVTAPLSRAVVLGSGRVVPFDGPAEN